MNFEPQKFLIGLIDFFSIILPGALLTYLLKVQLGPTFPKYAELDSAEHWMVFLFSSYLVGHFIFLLGALLDFPYDLIRNAPREHIEALARGKKPAWNPARLFAALCFKDEVDRVVGHAVKIKGQYLRPLAASSAINAFQWCKAKLTLEHPAAIATVQRFEADSKFFRSLVVVLCLLIVWGIARALCLRDLEATWHDPTVRVAAFALMLAPLAFWRYVEQRGKATVQAYWYLITLEAQKDGVSTPSSQAHAADGPSHAGGVVYSTETGEVKYLLVRANSEEGEWVLPKGHIEPGEKPRETAVREVREETGVWARVMSELGFVSFVDRRGTINTQFYLMECLRAGKAKERHREHTWLPLEHAKRQLKYPESQSLLQAAEVRRAGVARGS